MTPESSTEPRSMAQLCQMQEGLLLRCLEYVAAGMCSEDESRLLDDLRAHVDPDALPVDPHQLASANVYLHGLINRYAAACRAEESAQGMITEILEEKHAAHDALLHAAEGMEHYLIGGR